MTANLKLQGWMTTHGCEDREVAAEIGVALSTFRTWVDGKSVPTPKNAAKVFELTGIRFPPITKTRRSLMFRLPLRQRLNGQAGTIAAEPEREPDAQSPATDDTASAEDVGQHTENAPEEAGGSGLTSNGSVSRDRTGTSLASGGIPGNDAEDALREIQSQVEAAERDLWSLMVTLAESDVRVTRLKALLADLRRVLTVAAE